MSVGDAVSVVEAISAALVPIGGGLGATLRWRKNAQRERNAREEATRISAQVAADAVRAEVKAEQEKTAAQTALLMAEKDKTILRLAEDLTSERLENRAQAETILDLTKQAGGNGRG